MAAIMKVVYIHWKEQTKLSRRTNCQSYVVRIINQSIAKRHQCENCDYYKVLYGR